MKLKTEELRWNAEGCFVIRDCVFGIRKTQSYAIDYYDVCRVWDVGTRLGRATCNLYATLLMLSIGSAMRLRAQIK